MALFNEKRNDVKREVIKSKRLYVLNKIKSKESSPKKYWTELNRVMPVGRKADKKQTKTIELVDESDTEIESDLVANYINKFFCGIGSSLGDMINVDNSDYLAGLKNTSSPEVMDSWFKTNDLEIIALVEDININKSSNIQGLEIKYLKDCFRVSIDKLIYLFNLIFTTSIFPSSWKIATVTPPL